jgi:hypothetical protein
MSWDADFSIRSDGQLVPYRDWNFTHNTSPMIYAVWSEEDRARATRRRREHYVTMDAPDFVERLDRGELRGSWYDGLDGLSGAEGADYLGRILTGLRADPARFRAMNPENKWGSYDHLVEVLDDMYEVSLSFPSGAWEASG